MSRLNVNQIFYKNPIDEIRQNSGDGKVRHNDRDRQTKKKDVLAHFSKNIFSFIPCSYIPYFVSDDGKQTQNGGGFQEKRQPDTYVRPFKKACVLQTQITSENNEQHKKIFRIVIFTLKRRAGKKNGEQKRSEKSEPSAFEKYFRERVKGRKCHHTVQYSEHSHGKNIQFSEYEGINRIQKVYERRLVIPIGGIKPPTVHHLKNIISGINFIVIKRGAEIRHPQKNEKKEQRYETQPKEIFFIIHSYEFYHIIFHTPCFSR